MNSYQRLKKKNAELERQIRILVNEPDSPEAFIIKYQIMFKDDMDKVVLFGSRTTLDKPFEGLIKYVDE